MKILILGDLMGNSGKKVLQENLRKQMQRMIAEQTRELEEM